MTFARTFTERTTTALLSFFAMGMATGGLGLTGLGVTLRQIDSDVEGMPIITAGLITLGGVLAVSGGVSVIRTRMAGRSSGRSAVGHRGALSLAAVAIPLGLAVFLAPLISYWQDVLRLAVEYRVLETFNGPSGLVFVPIMGVLLVPILEAAAAILVALSCLLLILLIAVRSTEAPRVTTIAAILLVGLVAGSWIGVVTTERLAPAVEQVIRDNPDPGGREQARASALLTRQREVGMSSAWMLSWAGAAMVLLAFGVRTFTSSVETPEPLAPPLQGLDDATRAEALLDAADNLYRTTPPRRY